MTFRKSASILLSLIINLQSLPALSQDLSAATMKKVFVEINKDLPRMIDEDTRLDRIDAGHGEAVYYYTLVNYTYDQFDWKVLTEAILEKAEINFCTSPDMEAFRVGGVSMLYIYNDKNGELAGTIKIPNNIC